MIGILNREYVDMAQAIRSNKGVAQPSAYWETLRERICSGKAVQVVNRVIEGDETVTAIQANMSWRVLDKLLPSIAAVSVEVTHRQATSIDDLRNRAEALGVDPATLLSQVIDSTAEKIESTPIASDTPIPRDVDA